MARVTGEKVELHLSELITPGAIAAELKKAAEEIWPRESVELR